MQHYCYSTITVEKTPGILICDFESKAVFIKPSSDLFQKITWCNSLLITLGLDIHIVFELFFDFLIGQMPHCYIPTGFLLCPTLS